MNALDVVSSLQDAWWFGSSASHDEGRVGHAAAAADTPSAGPSPREAPGQQQQQQGLLSSWWWPFTSGAAAPPRPGAPAGRGQGGKPRIARQRSVSNGLEAAAKPRAPRPPGASKLQPPAAAKAAAKQPAAGAAAAPAAAGLAAGEGGGAAAGGKKQLGARQGKAEGAMPRTSSKANLKQLSYQERRRLWHERWVCLSPAACPCCACPGLRAHRRGCRECVQGGTPCLQVHMPARG